MYSKVLILNLCSLSRDVSTGGGGGGGGVNGHHTFTYDTHCSQEPQLMFLKLQIKNHSDGDSNSRYSICIMYNVYNASITWNWAEQGIKSNTDISDFSISSAEGRCKSYT